MRFVFGVDYYPEYWPRSRWDRDAELMAELSFNVVRLAEFSWSRLEPRDGVYDFGWLDEAIDILAKKGMKVILGTPTAAPPPWLVRRYPDILRMDPNGVRSPAGTRRNYCPNNPSYIMYTRRIVERMASHYRDNPYVIGWQIDNEFGIDPCYCDNCVEAFRDWLRGRYRDIEVLNRSWGSVFWSQEYGDWSEVQPPRPPLDMQNPSLCLDWHRFMSDSWVKYQKIQIEIIRRIASHHIVTHNLMGLYKELDYFKIAEPLDIVSFDYYPKRSLITDYARGAMAHDVMRSLKKKGYWVMELQSGAIKTSMAPIPKPGEIRLWTFQSVARGADGILYFTWRTCRFGAEEYWHGILDHDGVPRRRFFEVKKISEDLRRVAPHIEGTSVKPEIAFTLVYDSIWAWDLELTYGGRSYYGLSSWDPALDFYRALYSKNIAVDFADPSREDLSRYKVVFAPSLILMNEHMEDKLRGYVKDGGTLVATPRTGAKDWNNVIVDSTLPGGLSDVFGIHVEEYTGLPDDSRVYMEMNGAVTGGKIEMSGRCWAEMLSLRGADAIAYYKTGLYKDRPAVTMNRYGKGIAIYIGSFLDTSSYMPFTDWLIRTLGIKPILPPLDGVEAIERISSDGRIRIIFVLNYNEAPVRIHLVEECLDILAGERVQGEIEVNGLDVKVFKSFRLS